MLCPEISTGWTKKGSLHSIYGHFSPKSINKADSQTYNCTTIQLSLEKLRKKCKDSLPWETPKHAPLDRNYHYGAVGQLTLRAKMSGLRP
jgi:hypothetical protein